MEPIKNPDSTLTPGFDDTPLAAVSEPRPPWDDGFPEQAMCGLLAAQIAMYRLLKGLKVQVGSFEAYLAPGGPGKYGPAKEIRIHHVNIDMPASDDEIQPYHAAIIELSPQIFGDDIRPYMLKGVWRENYSLRCLSKTKCTLGVVCWFAHTNERRAFRAALIRSLLAEQKSERAGRIIVVPEYYDQTVRFKLTDAGNVDQDSLANHRTLQMTVEADVDEIQAIKNPEIIRTQYHQTVGTDVTP